MDGGVASYEEAQRMSRLILAQQQAGGVDTAAASVEEAYEKARMLMQAAGGLPVAAPAPRFPARDHGQGTIPAIRGARRDRAGFVGDYVALKPLQETMVAMANSPCGWNDLMTRYCGRTGRIVKITSNGLVKIQFPDAESWVVTPDALERPQEEETFHPTLGSPRRDHELDADDAAAVLNSRRMHRVLLVGDTAEGLEDCKTAYHYLKECGFNANMSAKVVAPPGALEGMTWLTDDVRSGDACFVLLNCAGEADITGADLLRPLARLPSGSKVTIVTTAHACGTGGALLDLPFAMSATREGGFTSSERPVMSLSADVTVIGTWVEQEFSEYMRGQQMAYMALVVQALSVCERRGPRVHQFLGDLRELLTDHYGAHAPLPKIASTRKLTDRPLSLLPTIRVNCDAAPAASPFVRYRDYTSSAAARLPPPAIEGKCVALGDADTRAWVIFCVHSDRAERAPGALGVSRVAVYNSHPCFSLVVYNWVGNDDVIPLGDTQMAPHHSKPDEGMVYTLTVGPGETQYFLDGVFVDGDAWRPGWRQERVDDALFSEQQHRIATGVAQSYAKTRGVSDVLETQGVEVQTAAFSTVMLLDACCEVARHDVAAPAPADAEKPSWVTGFLSDGTAAGQQWFVDMTFPPDEESLGSLEQLRSGSTRPFASPDGGDAACHDEMVLWGRPEDFHPVMHTPVNAVSPATALSPTRAAAVVKTSPERRAGMTGTLDGVFPTAHRPLPNDVSPGKFKSPVVLSALACIAEQGDILDLIFNANRKEYLAVGGCRLQLCVKGWWQEVTIDTTLPMVRRPIGSVMWLPGVTHSAKQHGDQASLWPSLVEKGLAKVYGSYGELYSCGDSLLDFLRTMTGRCVRVFGLEKCSFDDLCEWMDNGELLVFLPTVIPGAERDNAPRLRYSYPMIQYDRRREQVCVRDNWSGCGLWDCEEAAETRAGEGIGAVQGGRWVSNDALASLFAQVVRVSRPVGGELRAWLQWGEDGFSEAMLRIEVRSTTVFNVLCQQQHHGTTQDVPITLFTRQATGYLKHYRTFRTSFEVTLSPSNGPLYLALPEECPCAEGAVLELLYRAEALGTSLGTITACGPAGAYLRALEAGGSTPEHHPREILAQHRRDVTNGFPQTVAEMRSEFVL
eukprot:TRINITY_DN21170_c0_g1_i1.p1 TRINITY_DN21170_c0_g1~~TRINITY_DN21170_c0_g1_i1.p1  ORF type:complete len:1135 (+),score=398.42 TRINITY_DN21170_c0_g1_i1:49-3453(+)